MHGLGCMLRLKSVCRGEEDGLLSQGRPEKKILDPRSHFYILGPLEGG